jgi:hypothetical protein
MPGIHPTTEGALMFLYGNMLREKDRFVHNGQWVQVMDRWQSWRKGRGQWVDLWEVFTDQPVKPLTVLYVPDFEPFGDVRRSYRPVLIGASRKYNASNLHN